MKPERLFPKIDLVLSDIQDAITFAQSMHKQDTGNEYWRGRVDALCFAKHQMDIVCRAINKAVTSDFIQEVTP